LNKFIRDKQPPEIIEAARLEARSKKAPLPDREIETSVDTGLFAAFARGGANTQMQRLLQVNFVKEYQPKFNEIRNAVEEGDIVLAHRLTHSLKGNAGIIGKNNLKNAAADMERLLKDGNPPTGEQLSFLEAKLNAVLQEFMPVFEEETGKPGKSP
jgi:two-component system sensor histidine kinase/response regulator